MTHRSTGITAALSLGLLTVLLIGLPWAIPAMPGPSGYHLLKTIPVGGTEGWDYVTMDNAARRVGSAHRHSRGFPGEIPGGGGCSHAIGRSDYDA